MWFFRSNKTKKEPSKKNATVQNIPQNPNDEIELTVAEIELLNWCHNKPVSTRFPEHLWFNYGIKESAIANLIERGYIHYAEPFEALNGLTVSQLKDILKTKQLKISGNKKELISRIEENFSPKFLAPLIKERIYCVSGKGIKYLYKQKEKPSKIEISTSNIEQQLLSDLNKAISENQFNTAIQTINKLCKLTNDMNYFLIAFCIDICGLTNFNFLETYGVPKWRQKLMRKAMSENKFDSFDLEVQLRNIWKEIYPKFPVSIVNSIDDAITLLNYILEENIEEFNILINRLYSNLPDKYKADWRK